MINIIFPPEKVYSKLSVKHITTKLYFYGK